MSLANHAPADGAVLSQGVEAAAVTGGLALRGASHEVVSRVPDAVRTLCVTSKPTASHVSGAPVPMPPAGVAEMRRENGPPAHREIESWGSKAGPAARFELRFPSG